MQGGYYYCFGGFINFPALEGIGCHCYYEFGSKEQVVKIPYGNPMSDWRVIKEDKIMAMEITNNYSSYAAQSVAESGATSEQRKKKKETEKQRKQQESNKGKRQLIMQMNWRNLFQV